MESITGSEWAVTNPERMWWMVTTVRPARLAVVRSCHTRSQGRLLPACCREPWGRDDHRPPVHLCLDLHGPHDLRHTFATWLEDAGISSRVIDELMGHVGTKRERAQGASPMGRVYRETTLAMAARVTEVLDEKMALARKIAANLLMNSCQK